MSAYVVISVTPTDHEKFREYEEASIPILDKFGGRLITRDTDVHVVGREDVPAIATILEFPSKEQFRKFFDSPEYAPLKEFRLGIADASAIVLDMPS